MGRELDKYLFEYFEGTISNVDKDMIDILVMTDPKVSKKFHEWKQLKIKDPLSNYPISRTSIRTSRGTKWALPAAFGVGALAIWLAIPSTSSVSDEAKPDSIPEATITVIESPELTSKEQTSPEQEILINQVTEPDNRLIEEVKPAEAAVQEFSNEAPQIIVAAKASPQTLPLLDNAPLVVSENKQTTDKKRSDKLPILRKGKKPTVVPITVDGF